MQHTLKTILFILLGVLGSGSMVAQDASSPSAGETNAVAPARGFSSLLLGVGKTNQYDSYISPLEYTGPAISMLYEREKQLKGGTSPVSFYSLLNIKMHTTQSQATSARCWGGNLQYDAGWHYHWKDVLWKGLGLKAGGLIAAYVGGLYSERNGNNPANAHIDLHMAASVGADYAFRIKRLPLTLRYQADLPLLGAAFSPNYGQSYYEMSEYGYDHNIVATHPGNALSLRQLFTLDVKLKKASLRLGYQADLRQAKLNHLEQHQWTRSFMIGWLQEIW